MSPDIVIKPDETWISKFDPVFYDIIHNKHLNYIFPGGRGSTKSTFVGIMIPLLIISNPGTHAVVLRKVGNTLKTSVYAQIQWGIGKLGLYQYFTFHTNPMEIIYKPTGQKILFLGLDDAGKLKSIKLPFGWIAYTWWEELDQYSGEAEIRKVLQSTMRGGVKYQNFMSFNPPVSATNWANTYTRECEIKRQTDTLVVRSTYLDVPRYWLGEKFIEEAEILKQTNYRAYRNEYLGEAVGSGGNIFPNVTKFHMTDEMIGNFDHVFNGLDWGFANDPNAYTKTHYDRNHNDIYVFGEFKSTHMSNKEIFNCLYVDKAYNKKVVNRDGNMVYIASPYMELTELITADSAEPKSIADFKSYGCAMRGVEKFSGSVRYGIKWLQSLNHIYIDDKRCPYCYDELSQYEYDRDKNGEIISGFPDHDNHFSDSLRYSLSKYYKHKGN